MTEYTEKEMIEAVLEWSENQDNFDDHFIVSLAKQLERTGSLSEKQALALSNIIENFNINIEEWL